MMTTAHIFIYLLLFYGIQANSADAQSEHNNDQSTDNIKCVDANDCPLSDECRVCDSGYGPECPQPTCIHGKCGVIQPCSQETATEAHSPCNMNSVKTKPTTLSTPANNCTQDRQCSYKQSCATQCAEGTGPLCTIARCRRGMCVTITPCSENTKCNATDLSQCVVPNWCTTCSPGYSPRCAAATCVNGKCKIVQPCSIQTTTSTTPTTTVVTTTPGSNQCVADADCAYVKQCVSQCEQGYQPLCATASCVQGNCVITPPCSQAYECTPDDTSACLAATICTTCLSGFSPPCTQITCDNGRCTLIEPCSINTGTTTTITPVTTVRTTSTASITTVRTTTTTPSTTVRTTTNGASTTTVRTQCNRDSDCTAAPTCVDRCTRGYSPRCSRNVCRNGFCAVIAPCSQRRECTRRNVTQCNVTPVCRVCRTGYTPDCTSVTCVDGLCNIIEPCSINSATTTTTVPTTTANGASTTTVRTSTVPSGTTSNASGQSTSCCKSGQCPHQRVCVANCRNGTAPTCSSVKCVNGQCTFIPPCSQQACETARTCPVNRSNCAECGDGFWPRCEVATCKCGVCSVIKPCSKKCSRSCGRREA